jgi:hypothetical protein
MGNGAFFCESRSLAAVDVNLEMPFVQGSARQRRARAGCSASVQRPALRFGSPALLGLVARRPTRCAHFVRYAQTAGDKSVDEARCARGPQALRCSAPHRRCATCPGTPLQNRRRFSDEELTPWTSRRAAPGGGDLWGDEERRAEVGARQRASSTDSRRLFEGSERSERSELAARPRTEHRSAVGAKRRPLHHEPSPGAACRDAPTSAETRTELSP